MRRLVLLTVSFRKKVDPMNDRSFFKARMMASLVVMALMTTAVLVAVMGPQREGADAATSIGSITVSGGNTRTYTGVNYLLDGDISVSGTGSTLTFINSTITLSQDVGSDGVLGGGDDHIYSINVSSGGKLEFRNSVLTTQTDQLKPYFAMNVSVHGTGSQLVLKDTLVEGPGTISASGGAHLDIDNSVLKELTDKTNLNYDIDGDGGSGDDRDYNDDGPLLSISSGATCLVRDSEIRDTFSFDVASRDGLWGGNITLDGSGTNLTVINSFLDIDLETNLSTGSHNILKLSGGAEAHLVGMSINNTAQPSNPAIVIEDSSSSAKYYRWIAARITDGMNIQIEDQGITVLRVEGSVNTELTSSYLTSDILSYMGRTSLTWNTTDDEGWAFIPVITDIFTYDSMPNSDVTPDFSVRVSISGETLSASTSFDSYPTLPSQGDESQIFQRVRSGDDFSTSIVSDLGGTLGFSRFVVDPASSSFFGSSSQDTVVTSTIYITGTSSLIDGVFYPSYYAFSGHLVVSNGGHLVINDTTVNFLTDQGPAYILVENGGHLEMNNVSLSSRGSGDLYVYLLGSGSPTLTLDRGSMDIGHMVARDTAVADIHGDSFKGSLNLYGPSVNISLYADRISLSELYSYYNSLELSGGVVSVEDLEWKMVDLTSKDANFTIPIDIDGTADLINTTFFGNLSSGRTTWYKAVGSGSINVYYWADVKVVDSVDNPLAGADIHISRIVSGNEISVSTLRANESGMVRFELLQEEVKASGRTYLGNYRISAEFRGYSSPRYSTVVSGRDVDAVVTIPGGPNLIGRSLMVEGTLIAGNTVSVLGNISNIGEFDAGHFNVELQIGNFVVDSAEVGGLGAGMNVTVPFRWTAEEGDLTFILKIDPYEELRETGEDDNIFTQVNYIGSGPDYQVILQENTTEWVLNTQGTVDVVIYNVGEEDPSETPFKVNVTWTGAFGGGVVMLEIPVDYIPPGESVRIPVNWTPEIVGPVTLSAIIDSRFDRVPINSVHSIQVIVKDLPELAILTGSFNVDAPVPVTINTTVNISFSVTNLGEMTAGQFKVSVYDGIIDGASRISAPIAVSGLEPGEQVELSVRWFAGLPIGSHKLIIVLDEDDEVMEQSEEDNIWEFPILVDTPPDIKVSADESGVAPSMVTEGRNTTIWAWVSNIGKTMGRDVVVHFSIDSDVNVIAERKLDLLPGERVNISFKWSAESVGEHTLFIIADPYDNLIEEGAGESNNIAFLPLTVLSKPDIYMSENDLRILPDGVINIGDDVTIYATIRNSGQTDALNVFVRFYDGDPEKGGRLISFKPTQPSVVIERLEAESTTSFEVPWTPGSGGYHDIFVIMDLSNLIQETDETNNQMSWKVYVQTLPDLVITNLTFYQSGVEVDSAGVGKTLTINVTLENIGDTSSPSFRLLFFNGEFVNDPLASSIGDNLLFPGNSLLGHSSRYVEIGWTVVYPKGIRTVFAAVELLDGEEQRTDNNHLGRTLEVFDIEDVPEIGIDPGTLRLSSRYSGMSPSETGVGYLGTNISVMVNVTNHGGKTASNTTILFVVSNSTDSWVEYSTYIEFLESNATDTVVGFWMLDTPGENKLEILVDPENRVREFDEGNNALDTTIEVQEAPDLTVALQRAESKGYNFDKGIFEMTKGKEYIVVYDIINTGNFTYHDVEVTFTGPAINARQTVTIPAFGVQRVTFTVKPETAFSEEVAWKCKVNEGEGAYESDYGNNEAVAMFSVSVPEEPTSYLLLIIIILVIVIALIIAVGIYVYMKMQTGEKAKCSNCGGLVPLDAVICPHCGVEFSDELECECGEPIPPGATECPSCGRPVTASLPKVEGVSEEEETEEMEPESEEEEEVEEAPAEELEELSETEMPSDEEEAGEELAECFECGALIPVSAPICPHCGAVFE